MNDVQNARSPFRSMVGQTVVVDTRANYLYIGILQSADAHSMVLEDVDVHDTAQSNTSADLYLIQALKHGVRANRRRTTVLAREIVSVSLLSDVIPY